MKLDFDDLLGELEDEHNEFEEFPVDIDTFMSDERYLGKVGMTLSPLQKKMVEASTEIYKKHTLIQLYGEEEGLARFKRIYNELCFMLGKGCQDYNDEVYNSVDGTYRKIGELVTTPEHRVASINGKSIGSEDATESWVEGYDEMYLVTTEQGIQTTVTANHKFLSMGGHFSELCTLSVGDRIASALNLPVENPKDLCPALCSLDEAQGLSKENLMIYLVNNVRDNSITVNSHREAIVVQRLFARTGRPSTIRAKNGRFKVKVIKDYYKMKRSGLIDGDIYWDKIVSIDPVGKKPFYTLTAMENHNYVSNGLIHANSGKNETTSIIVCYVVYKLLCLKDPAKYYGKPTGNAIDIINVALNADQAKRNFFDNVVGKIKLSPWFAGKYDPTAKQIKFDKNINVYSGNSKAESFEGYNLLMAILDEIAGFGVDSDAGNVEGDAIYNMFVDSVVSRYPEEGKVIMLSFPRFKGDFIDKYYNAAVKDKETAIKRHTFKIDPDLPDGIRDNEYEISWEEDHIISYSRPKVFCLRRPSWVINPTRVVDFYKGRFLLDPNVAYGKFACMPADSIDSYFGSKEKVEKAFRLRRLMVDENGVFAKTFVPEPGVRYYMHVDLGQVQDRSAVAMAHVGGWQQTNIFGDQQLVRPKIVVDFVRYWTPTRENIIDLSEVKRFIFNVIERGFDIGLVTFDQWHSVDIILELNGMGIKAEKLSLKKEHYDDFKLAVYEERVVGPYIPILIDELIKLRVTKTGKVDHIAGAHNDMAEAITGAIYNATAKTERYMDQEVEVLTYEDLRRQTREAREEELQHRRTTEGLIVAPPKMPKDMEEYLREMKIL